MSNHFFCALAIASLTITACAKTDATAPPEKISANSCVTAALIFAEWCPSCQVLEPKLAEAQTLMNDAEVSFVNLDFTTRKAEAVYDQATEFGIDGPLRAKFGDKVLSGLVLVVDTNKNQIIDTITKRAAPKDIADKLTTAAKNCKV